jgi:hypothetical protein
MSRKTSLAACALLRRSEIARESGISRRQSDGTLQGRYCRIGLVFA